ncbi:hypothetical protein ACKGJO_05275 [Gracilimonas sp. Q87]|uniref:hypothetical protein n=1 Tax=Gracilimonas sp. Q87 TaxID=3384766 RepID=UPI003983E0FB
MKTYIIELYKRLIEAQHHLRISSVVHQMRNVVSYLSYLISCSSRPIKTQIHIDSNSVTNSLNEDKNLTEISKIEKIKSEESLEELLMELKKAIEEDEGYSNALDLFDTAMFNSLTLEESFFLINKIQLLYAGLEEPSQAQLIKSLNRNPVKQIVQYPPSLDELIDYNIYDEYFLYQANKDDEKLYFIKKSDLFKVKENLNSLVKNEWVEFPWKLN